MLRSIAARALLLSALSLGLLVAPAVAAPTVSGEFDVPGLGSNNKLVQGPDGNIWLTLDGNNRDVAKITPAGAVEEFDLGAVTSKGITADAQGRLWIARNGGVVSFLPGDPVGTKDVTDIALVGNEPSIAFGPDGNLWATGDKKVVRIPPDNPLGATEVPVPGLEAAKDIDAAGALIVVAGLEHVFAVSTAGAVVGDQKVAGQAQGVGGNPNGQYAFTQPGTAPKEIGLLAPAAAPLIVSAEGSDPFGIALGSDGAYWSPDFISDGVMRLTASGQLTTLTGFAKDSAPRQIAAGPGNTLWVTLEMTKKVGLVSGLEPPVAPQPPAPLTPAKKPNTQIKKGPKGKVTTKGKRAKVAFRFSSPDANVRFQCRLFRLTPPPNVRKGGQGGGKSAGRLKAPLFKSCKSPKRLKLAPGRYRFEVRAVGAAGPDPTPAKRSFRVVRVG